MSARYRRVLLKFSGELLLGKGRTMIDLSELEALAKDVKTLQHKGFQIAMVLGGGNIWRYRDHKGKGIPRVESDFLGMLATVMNGVAVQTVFEQSGIPTRLMSALPVAEVAEPYIRRKALDHLAQGRVLICAGGTGRPFFTTDTAAALRALELKCDVFLKATKVDGVYDADPLKNKKAKRFDTLSFDELLERKLGVMDLTAATLCREGKLPVVVFNMNKKGNLMAAVTGKSVGTFVH